jgi:DNA primase
MDNEIKNLFYATDKFLHFFSDNLNKSEEASDYLENRNIEKDTIKKFKIGYCPKIYDNILNFMDLEKIDHEIAKKIGIIKYDDNKKMYIPFSNRIVFPIFNPYD